MSAVAIRAALEVALAAMSPTLATAWENADFDPAPGTPYQQVSLLLAEPVNAEMGANANAYYTEQGFLQIDLKYPLGEGPAAATTRAQLLRSTFYRGASFTASGVTAHIERTPEILPGRFEDERYVVPVRIRFYAHVRN